MKIEKGSAIKSIELKISHTPLEPLSFYEIVLDNQTYQKNRRRESTSSTKFKKQYKQQKKESIQKGNY